MIPTESDRHNGMLLARWSSCSLSPRRVRSPIFDSILGYVFLYLLAAEYLMHHLSLFRLYASSCTMPRLSRVLGQCKEVFWRDAEDYSPLEALPGSEA